MELLFLRHGETDINTKGLTHKKGSAEHLNTIGREQAQSLVEVCRQHSVTKIYSSPEARAIETAEIIGQALGLEPIVLNELSERHWGDWEGLPWSEISAHLQPMTIEERYSFIPPNGESWQQMEDRLKVALNTIQAAGETVAVITHGGALRGLMPILKEEPLETSLRYDFRNASVTIFDDSTGRLKITLENDVSHLAD